MLFNQDRHQLRLFFLQCWQQHLRQEPLDPLAQQIVAVILDHPEYQPLLVDDALEKNYSFDGENPFLHMALHLSIREQLACQRPKNLLPIYQKLLAKYGSALQAEHQMLPVLRDCLYHYQQSGEMPSDEVYLTKLTALL